MTRPFLNLQSRSSFLTSKGALNLGMLERVFGDGMSFLTPVPKQLFADTSEEFTNRFDEHVRKEFLFGRFESTQENIQRTFGFWFFDKFIEQESTFVCASRSFHDQLVFLLFDDFSCDEIIQYIFRLEIFHRASRNYWWYCSWCLRAWLCRSSL